MLLIADVDPQVLTALVMNKVKGNIKINVIEAPTYGLNKKDTLDDLALLKDANGICFDVKDDVIFFSDITSRSRYSPSTEENCIHSLSDISKSKSLRVLSKYNVKT